MMDVRSFLRRKRDGERHHPEEIRSFVEACTRSEVPDYQLSAWLMAAFLEGLDDSETDALTASLAASGLMFDWRDLGRPSADKHSTGGVGDKVSLVLAPLVASCGVLVPMVSGRGLGHTGGTLDKLESIPGFRTRLSAHELRAQLARIGVAMIGQGPDLAPADGLLYAMRDVTATVESTSFIVASIVSKKLAEGAEAVIYDVKCGNGAFMKTREAARDLGRRLVAATKAQGRASSAFLTDMSQPLGRAVGNAVEVGEAVESLQERGPSDLREITLELGGSMLVESGAERDPARARASLESALASGAAWGKFVELVEAQGGDARGLEDGSGLPRAAETVAVPAARSGVVTGVDTFSLGELMVAMGAGRMSKEHAIDPAVGMRVQVRIGDRVAAGDPLAELHLSRPSGDFLAWAQRCFEIGEGEVASPALVLEHVSR